MKKWNLLLAAAFMFCLSIGANAQAKTTTATAATSNDYFTGKWAVLLKGIPSGDTKLIIEFQHKDTAYTVSLKDTTGNEAGKVNKVFVNDQSATVYFTAQGYDVDLVLEKKDDDHVVGRLMSMFDAEGDRIKETKTK